MRIGIVAMMATMAVCLTLPAALAQADCANWNSEGFFRTAGAADVRACLRAGADPDARDKKGVTPLHWAANNGNAAAVRALLEAGADPNARDDEHGDTPLHYAVFYSLASGVGFAGVGLLLDAGADPNVHDYTYGQTPLHNAASTGSAALVAMLLRAGADPNARANDGDTPLDLAILWNYNGRGVIRTLRAAGAVESE